MQASSDSVAEKFGPLTEEELGNASLKAKGTIEKVKSRLSNCAPHDTCNSTKHAFVQTSAKGCSAFLFICSVNCLNYTKSLPTKREEMQVWK